MKIYIGTNVKNLRDAQAWLLSPGVEESLRTFSTWIIAREEAWGECGLFIEVSCRRRPREKGSQIDLMVAFDDRIAICEVKTSVSYLTDAADQVTQQAELIKNRFRDIACRLQRRPAALLFLPLLTEQQLSDVHTVLNYEGFPHVRPAGCLPSGCASSLDIVSSIERWLAEPTLRSDGRSPSLSRLLRDKIVSSTFEPIESLDQLFRYLRDFRAPTQVLRQPTWHIASLRTGALSSGKDHLIGVSP